MIVFYSTTLKNKAVLPDLNLASHMHLRLRVMRPTLEEYWPLRKANIENFWKGTNHRLQIR
jgi:hypothetical protein